MQASSVVRRGWFGRRLTAMLSVGKSVTGELTEVTPNYIVLKTESGEKQLMVHAIVALWPANESSGQ